MALPYTQQPVDQYAALNSFTKVVFPKDLVGMLGDKLGRPTYDWINVPQCYKFNRRKYF